MRALVLLAALAACAANPARAKVCAGKNAILDNDRCGDAIVGVFLKARLVQNYHDVAVTRYVTSVGGRLARAAGDRRSWKFVILDDDDANAFVSLGSTIYLYRGTLAVLRSEAELAGVLAHEMAHLRGGHARDHWKEILRDEPRSAAQRLLDHKYARDDEIQADEHAVVLLAKAGYDPRAFATMLYAIAATDDAEEDPTAVHPWWPERIARAQAAAALQPPSNELGEARYRGGLATLVAGKDPRRLAVRIGNAVVVANARLAVDLPAGAPDPDDPGATTTVVLPDGASVSVIAVPKNLTWVFDLLKSEASVAIVTDPIGADTLVYMFHGKDAKARVKELRNRKRAARPDEIAQIRPAFVDFDAPRRLWTRPR